ncbi:MAG: 2OG-Fe(II) oxygenase [Erythrobacter sp.]|uniref:2OG-Fe(II) oxygenase n=1 Tax=Erythrobacter sp. TaxID=1042 RepID=UPI0025FD174F|nr:2OG-Fe(II) oxygenase [Erythrobacter sp.]MCM0000989.1 2OG-Fe(II) oxygenase [Erythrobacter sp.]
MHFPVCIIDDFLGSEACSRLLAFAVGRQAEFAPSRVHTTEKHQIIETQLRDSLSYPGPFGTLMAPFHAGLDASYDRIAAAIGAGAFERVPTELHMVAHRHGQYLGRHIDTGTSTTGSMLAQNRVVTLIYYFHDHPRAFGGGDLVVYPMTGDDPQVIEARSDRLVALPSFAPHEILPVDLPDGRFADSRFALVSWLVRPQVQPA